MDMLTLAARILAVISLLLLATFISFGSGQEPPITSYTCPEYFSEEAVGKVNCSLNTTQATMSSCLPYQTMVDFYFQNTSMIVLCSAAYNGKCDEEPVGEMNCSCAESEGEMFLYQLNFRGNRTVYEGGLLGCEVRCIPSLQLYSTGSKYCAHLNYGEPPASTSSTPPVEREGETSAITSYICPDYFSEETVEKMNCSLNSTEVRASYCLPYPTMVDFYFSNTSSMFVLCSAPYNGKCDEEPVGEMNCSCVESDGEMFLYQLNFRGKRTVYEGGALSCDIRCISSIGFYSTGQSCDLLKFEEEAATVTSSTPLEREGPRPPIISYTCPEYFSEEATGKVNCSLNTTQATMSSCLPYQTMVDFYFQNTSMIVLCSAAYNGKCDEDPLGDMNCSCVESEGEMFLYQLNFRGNRTVYEGGLLGCEIRCIPSLQLYSTGSKYCGHLNYEGEAPAITSSTPPVEREVMKTYYKICISIVCESIFLLFSCSVFSV